MQSVTAPSRFEIVRQLGEGGMGIVFEALDRERGTHVALKTLRQMTPDALSRFKREFRALQDVHHPSLVSLGELISKDDQWFFTMELVDGDDFLAYVCPGSVTRSAATVGTLSSPFASEIDSLAKTREVPAAQARAVEGNVRLYDEGRLRDALRQLAQGLAALHEAGMVHRDIKPNNIRVTSTGRLVLLDFGLVADYFADNGASATHMVGTPAYMAPEQAAGRGAAPAADWYSVGVLLFEALTGMVPFDGAPLQIMLAKQQREPPLPSTLASRVPPDLDALCAALLRHDPGHRPKEREVLRALGVTPTKASPLRTPSSHTQAMPFVGRNAEHEALRAAYEDSRAKGAVTVFVAGESGIGKSCFVKHFARALETEDKNVLVLAGRCYERESVPYKAFDGVVDALTRFLMGLSAHHVASYLPAKPAALVQVFPVLRRVQAIARATRQPTTSVDPLELRARAFASMRELFVRIAEERPLIVIVDDIQWADAESLALLAEVVRAPDAPRALLVLTMRTAAADGTSPSTGEMRAPRRDEIIAAVPGDVRMLGVERLSDAEAIDLAALLLHRAAPAAKVTASAIAREAQGHPLFIDALVRHVAMFPEGATLSVRLDDAIRAQVQQIDSSARQLVELLAVAGAPLTQDVLAAASGLERADFAKATSFLRVAHLVTTTGARGVDKIEPHHDRVRSAVAAKMPPAQKEECHRRIAVALEASGNGDAEALSVHWLGADDLPHAARYAVLAGDQAAEALAFDRAANLYELALGLREPDDAERRLLQEKLGDALASAGRGALAATAYGEAARGAHPSRALDLQRRAADQLFRSGHFDEGLAAIERVLAAIGMRLPKSPFGALVSFLFRRALLRVRGLGFRERDESEIPAHQLTRFDVYSSVAFGLAIVDTIRGAAFQARSLLLALSLGEPKRLARALAMEVGYVSTGGGKTWRRTAALIELATAIAQRAGSPNAVGFVEATVGVAHYMAGRFVESLAHLERAREIMTSQCTGMAWDIDTVQFFALNCLAQRGDLVEVARRTPLYLREALDRGDRYAAVNLRIGYTNLRWLVADDPTGGEREIEEAMREWSKQGFHVEHYFEFIARTNTSIYAGRAKLACERVNERWPALERSLLLRIQPLRVSAWNARARAALAAAEAEGPSDVRDALITRAARDARAIARERMPWAAALAQLIEACVAAVRNETPERVAELLRKAMNDSVRADMALHAAVARRALSKVAGGSEGTALGKEADDWFRAQGVKAPSKLAAMIAPGLRRFTED